MEQFERDTFNSLMKGQRFVDPFCKPRQKYMEVQEVCEEANTFKTHIVFQDGSDVCISLPVREILRKLSAGQWMFV